MSINPTYFFSSLSFFFITLQSLYFPGIGLSVFPVLGAFGLLFLGLMRYDYKIKFSIFNKFGYYLFFVSLFFVFKIFVDISLGGYYKGLLSFFVIMIAVLSVILVFNGRQTFFHSILGFAILLHVLFFFLQAIVWFSTGYFLDYVLVLTGEHSSYISVKGITLFGERVPRFTGLFNEPGTYSVWIFSLISIYYFIKPKPSSILFVALISMLFSLSLYGAVMSISMIFIMILRGGGFLKRLILLSPLFIPVGYVVVEMDRRLSSDYSGLDFRFAAFQSIFDPAVFFFGGFFSDKCSGQLLDVSIPVFLICEGGIFYLVLFLAAVFSVGFLRHSSMLIATSLLIVSKIKLTYPLFWVYLVSILLIRYSMNSKKQTGYVNAPKTIPL